MRKSNNVNYDKYRGKYMFGMNFLLFNKDFGKKRYVNNDKLLWVTLLVFKAKLLVQND